MAGKRKAPAKKSGEAKIEIADDGQWWIVVDGKRKQDVGRSRRYAEQMLERYK